jgi:hypothetical protein
VQATCAILFAAMPADLQALVVRESVLPFVHAVGPHVLNALVVRQTLLPLARRARAGDAPETAWEPLHAGLLAVAERIQAHQRVPASPALGADAGADADADDADPWAVAQARAWEDIVTGTVELACLLQGAGSAGDVLRAVVAGRWTNAVGSKARRLAAQAVLSAVQDEADALALLDELLTRGPSPGDDGWADEEVALVADIYARASEPAQEAILRGDAVWADRFLRQGKAAVRAWLRANSPDNNT